MHRAGAHGTARIDWCTIEAGASEMDPAIIPVTLIGAGFIVQLIVQQGITSRYDYRCGNCGQTFSLTPLAASVVPHRFGGSKLARCPHCGVRSWVWPVPKQ
jgi:DNA-directed RNA polymerase subunit RPC12/RpoP